MRKYRQTTRAASLEWFCFFGDVPGCAGRREAAQSRAMDVSLLPPWIWEGPTVHETFYVDSIL